MLFAGSVRLQMPRKVVSCQPFFRKRGRSNKLLFISLPQRGRGTALAVDEESTFKISIGCCNKKTMFYRDFSMPQRNLKPALLIRQPLPCFCSNKTLGGCHLPRWGRLFRAAEPPFGGSLSEGAPAQLCDGRVRG